MLTMGKNEIISEKPMKLIKIADAPVTTPMAIAPIAPTKTAYFALSSNYYAASNSSGSICVGRVFLKIYESSSICAPLTFDTNE